MQQPIQSEQLNLLRVLLENLELQRFVDVLDSIFSKQEQVPTAILDQWQMLKKEYLQNQQDVEELFPSKEWLQSASSILDWLTPAKNDWWSDYEAILEERHQLVNAYEQGGEKNLKTYLTIVELSEQISHRKQQLQRGYLIDDTQPVSRPNIPFDEEEIAELIEEFVESILHMRDWDIDEIRHVLSDGDATWTNLFYQTLADGQVIAPHLNKTPLKDEWFQRWIGKTPLSADDRAMLDAIFYDPLNYDLKDQAYTVTVIGISLCRQFQMDKANLLIELAGGGITGIRERAIMGLLLGLSGKTKLIDQYSDLKNRLLELKGQVLVQVALQKVLLVLQIFQEFRRALMDLLLEERVNAKDLKLFWSFFDD